MEEWLLPVTGLGLVPTINRCREQWDLRTWGWEDLNKYVTLTYISSSRLFTFTQTHPFSVFQTVSINKAINTQEVAVKEKHARNILFKVGSRTSKRGS